MVNDWPKYMTNSQDKIKEKVESFKNEQKI